MSTDVEFNFDEAVLAVKRGELGPGVPVDEHYAGMVRMLGNFTRMLADMRDEQFPHKIRILDYGFLTLRSRAHLEQMTEFLILLTKLNITVRVESEDDGVQVTYGTKATFRDGEQRWR